MLTWVIPKLDSYAARCWLEFGIRKGEVARRLVEVLLDGHQGELIREVELVAKIRTQGFFRDDPGALHTIEEAWAELLSFNEVMLSVDELAAG